VASAKSEARGENAVDEEDVVDEVEAVEVVVEQVENSLMVMPRSRSLLQGEQRSE
jgi:hypothetical protein